MTLTRRAFLATGASALVASSARATNQPRIAAIDWAMAETAAALHLPLVALAEKRQFVRASSVTLPKDCADVGLRGTPNLEALSLVAPELILSSNFYSFVEPQLERIAPVYTRQLFVPQEPTLPKVLFAMEALAEHLNLGSRGQQIRGEYETAFDQLAKQAAEYSDRPCILMTVGDARHVQIYGTDSIYGGALTRIGLSNAWNGGTEFAFNAPVPLSKLIAFPEARLVVVGALPVSARRAIEQSALWSALKPVRAGRVLHLNDKTPFGGAPSALRFADHLVTALEHR
ncbi:ABC transporter substrate-binding protein [Sulfitobacter sp. CW3]|uniref:ABC transporter substrate-binding protein n=1 Tax=Sulfitobacter sp. CW3 TaxID=2861965 RepID=UPI001C5E305D|nr:ABC transporter substrate-binding protein [Sulfitobacter sp. CW3]MBW4960656.1 ABC transporter substrate-binding protein [Sulfitobacter sp. CW3]